MLELKQKREAVAALKRFWNSHSREADLSHLHMQH
jgi:hypothetical protein